MVADNSAASPSLTPTPVSHVRIAIAVLSVSLCQAWALTEPELQTFIDEAIRSGGGEVMVPPGVHEIRKGLILKDAKKVRLVGYDNERSILRLPPLAYAQVDAAAKPGDQRLSIKSMNGITVGMQIQIEADGDQDSFTHKPKPYQLATIAAVEPAALLLTAALRQPVPAGTLARDAQAPNLIELRGACESITIDKLCLDGGRKPSDPPVRGHAQLCGVFAQSPYSYEKGPSGPLIKGLTVSRCIIQHCHGRGIALYAVDSAIIADCTIMDTTDEAIDLDHFTIKSIVRHNHIARSLVGVELNDANDCLISANEIRDCKTGIHMWQWSPQPNLNQGNRIVDNLIESIPAQAIQIQSGLKNNELIGNEIRDPAPPATPAK
jgi:Right handed beta helix region